MIKPILIDIQCALNRFRFSQVDFGRPDRYLFAHIPKTAGTTFRYILYNHVKSADIFPSRAMLHRQGRAYLSQDALEARYDVQALGQQYHMMCGHFSHSQIKHYGPAFPKTITFLREPTARTISHLRHVSAETGESLEAVWARSSRTLSNFQAKQFGYVAEKNNVAEVLKAADVCFFIGLSEHFKDSLDRLNKATGWQLKNTRARNANPNRGADVSQELRGAITAHMNVDVALYRHILTGFE